jgi:hypothetical protein
MDCRKHGPSISPVTPGIGKRLYMLDLWKGQEKSHFHLFAAKNRDVMIHNLFFSIKLHVASFRTSRGVTPICSPNSYMRSLDFSTIKNPKSKS